MTTPPDIETQVTAALADESGWRWVAEAGQPSVYRGMVVRGWLRALLTRIGELRERLATAEAERDEARLEQTHAQREDSAFLAGYGAQRWVIHTDGANLRELTADEALVRWRQQQSPPPPDAPPNETRERNGDDDPHDEAQHEV
jgi:hypothetical protein